MTPNEMKKKAIEMMAVHRFHCSQAVAASGMEKIEKPDNEIIRAMGAFGGGLGGNGEVCGALVGGLAVLGLRFSRALPEEKEDQKMWRFADELFRRFRDEIVQKQGSIYCRDIASVDWKNREQAKSFYSGDKVKECVRIVGMTALLVGELLERN